MHPIQMWQQKNPHASTLRKTLGVSKRPGLIIIHYAPRFHRPRGSECFMCISKGHQALANALAARQAACYLDHTFAKLFCKFMKLKSAISSGLAMPLNILWCPLLFLFRLGVNQCPNALTDRLCQSVRCIIWRGKLSLISWCCMTERATQNKLCIAQ